MMNLSPNGDVNFVELLDLGITSNVIVYIHTQGRLFNLDSAKRHPVLIAPIRIDLPNHLNISYNSSRSKG